MNHPEKMSSRPSMVTAAVLMLLGNFLFTSCSSTARSAEDPAEIPFFYNARDDYESLFSSYSLALNGPLKGKSVLNYISSHDDGDPFDPLRENPVDAGTRLLLCPGAAQVYYGDESSRSLIVEGARGDATLRGMMNWEEIGMNVEKNGIPVGDVLEHHGKLGRFCREHPSVGAGVHKMVAEEPYIFTRELVREGFSDRVMVGLGCGKGEKELPAGALFPDGTPLHDFYSGKDVTVRAGKVVLDSQYDLVLLGSR